jgi:DNA-binding MarR family transcriptional regulator
MARTLGEEIRQEKPFASAEEEVFLNLVRTAAWLDDLEARLLKQHGLSRPLYNVLRILRGAGPDGHPCQEIGARMITRVPDVTRLVDRLEARGLAARVRGTEDRRVVRIRLLDPGRALLASLDAPVSALLVDALGHLGPRKLAALNDLLCEARRRAGG